ncbi:MAG: aminoacyl-tRNA hydrolase [Alphaproteobacteria bacterium]
MSPQASNSNADSTSSGYLVVVGLGNPGTKYTKNRHNIGFRLIEAIASEYLFDPFKVKDFGMVASGMIAGRKVLLLKPMSYMNLSGQGVGQLLRYYNVDTEDVVVLHDDIDLQPAQVKVKKGGGHGGHNGLRSLDSHVGKDYHRVRFGVGHPGHRDLVADFVLRDFSKAEEKMVEPLIVEIAQEFHHIVEGNKEEFIQRLTGRQV